MKKFEELVGEKSLSYYMLNNSGNNCGYVEFGVKNNPLKDFKAFWQINYFEELDKTIVGVPFFYGKPRDIKNILTNGKNLSPYLVGSLDKETRKPENLIYHIPEDEFFEKINPKSYEIVLSARDWSEDIFKVIRQNLQSKKVTKSLENKLPENFIPVESQHIYTGNYISRSSHSKDFTSDLPYVGNIVKRGSRES